MQATLQVESLIKEEVYMRWRTNSMPLNEQRIFFKFLFTRTLKNIKYINRRYSNYIDDKLLEDVAINSIIIHLQNYIFKDDIHWKALSHLKKIIACQYVDEYRRLKKITLVDESSNENLESEIIENVFDEANTLPVFLQNFPSDPLQTQESTEKWVRLKKIFNQWDLIPEFSWKNTYGKWLPWKFENSDAKISDFIKEHKDELPKKTAIHSHIDAGNKQIQKWIENLATFPNEN